MWRMTHLFLFNSPLTSNTQLNLFISSVFCNSWSGGGDDLLHSWHDHHETNWNIIILKWWVAFQMKWKLFLLFLGFKVSISFIELVLAFKKWHLFFNQLTDRKLIVIAKKFFKLPPPPRRPTEEAKLNGLEVWETIIKSNIYSLSPGQSIVAIVNVWWVGEPN